jgi:hypothetical protein
VKRADKVRQVVELFGGDFNKVADGMGLSASHIKGMLRAENPSPCSLIIDLAAEGILRRFGKLGTTTEAPKPIAAICFWVSPDHWTTLEKLLTGSGGVVFDHALQEWSDGAHPTMVSIMASVPADKLDFVTGAIKALDGTIKGTVS